MLTIVEAHLRVAEERCVELTIVPVQWEHKNVDQLNRISYRHRVTLAWFSVYSRYLRKTSGGTRRTIVFASTYLVWSASRTLDFLDLLDLLLLMVCSICSSDVVVPLSCGSRTAASIPGAGSAGWSAGHPQETACTASTRMSRRRLASMACFSLSVEQREMESSIISSSDMGALVVSAPASMRNRSTLVEESLSVSFIRYSANMGGVFFIIVKLT